MTTVSKSSMRGLYFLMILFGLGVALFYYFGWYKKACMALGLELILYWAYLNPWILEEKYALFFFTDVSRMIYKRFLVAGVVIVAGAALSLMFNWPVQ